MPLPSAAVFQPLKVYPARVKAFVVSARGAIPDSGIMVPEPPLESNVTVLGVVLA